MESVKKKGVKRYIIWTIEISLLTARLTITNGNCTPARVRKMRNSPKYFVNFIYGIKNCHEKEKKRTFVRLWLPPHTLYPCHCSVTNKISCDSHFSAWFSSLSLTSCHLSNGLPCKEHESSQQRLLSSHKYFINPPCSQLVMRLCMWYIIVLFVQIILLNHMRNSSVIKKIKVFKIIDELD